MQTESMRMYCKICQIPELYLVLQAVTLFRHTWQLEVQNLISLMTSRLFSVLSDSRMAMLDFDYCYYHAVASFRFKSSLYIGCIFLMYLIDLNHHYIRKLIKEVHFCNRSNI